jgi:hypothetical protein
MKMSTPRKSRSAAMNYFLDAAGVLADALLVWWIMAGHPTKKITRESHAAIHASRS